MLDDNLEYLMNSLPNLVFKQEGEERNQVFSIFEKYANATSESINLIEILNAEAAKFISPEASDQFRQIDLQKIHEKQFQRNNRGLLSAFSKYMASLREAIKELRIARKENKQTTSGKGRAYLITPGNPLEEELQLLKLQWDEVESLSAGHFTDMDALVAYKLKLLILLKWWSFDTAHGFEIFESITKYNYGG